MWDGLRPDLCWPAVPLSHTPCSACAAVSLAAKEAHKNSMDYAKDRMSALYGEIGLPMPPEA